MSEPGDSCLLLQALRMPTSLRALSLAQWDGLLPQARNAGLMARLYTLAEAAGALQDLPEAPLRHLEAAVLLTRAQAMEVHREVAHLTSALQALDAPVVLLKGAAYLMAGLPAALGRSFSDIDILLPRALLPEAESCLMLHGWVGEHHDAYDQRYYREWMHEIPPLEHLRRGTVLDVHHRLLPETARLTFDPAPLFAAARPVAGLPGLQVLAPPDMVLHSLVHLLHNEEMHRGLRDLSDLDLLTRHFAADPAFWDALVARATELGLRRILYYGVRQVRRLLHSPVPAEVVGALRSSAPPSGLRWLMHGTWDRALSPLHSSCRQPGTAAALGLVYVRAHWMRMPAPLLLRHLAHKAHQAVFPPAPTAR